MEINCVCRLKPANLTMTMTPTTTTTPTLIGTHAMGHKVCSEQPAPSSGLK